MSIASMIGNGELGRRVSDEKCAVSEELHFIVKRKAVSIDKSL